MSAKTVRSVGRPADPALTHRIMDAGWQMFLASGIKAVSVEAIAAQAQVSKATFYKHFADKGALFEAAVLREMLQIERAQQLPRKAELAQTLEARLHQFGVGLMRFLVSPNAVNFYKSLSGELARHKPLARRFYDLGPGRTKANLTQLLSAAAQAGELTLADPEQAAEHLIGLWQGISNFELALGIHSARIRRSIPQRVDAGLQVFMAAYAPKRTETSRSGELAPAAALRKGTRSSKAEPRSQREGVR